MHEPSGVTIKVLVCDDHAILAEGVAAVLAAEPDISVVGVASSVAEVLEQTERHRPDVVLLDQELPDGDGVGAARRLKQAHPDTKVVMLTAYTNEAVMVGAIEAGCSGYIIKRDGSRVLAKGVRLAASGEALVSEAMLGRLLPLLSPTNRNPGWDLTPRELEVLELLADGVATENIAERMYVSSNTVRNHVQRVLQKLGAHSRLEAVSMAVRGGLIRRS